jgi:hypothetical protein
MTTKHIVTGPAVVIPTDDGSERYLYRGALVGSGYTKAGIKHALELGLIEEVEEVVIGDDTAVLALAAAAAEATAQAEAEAARVAANSAPPAGAPKTTAAKTVAK